MTERDKKKEKKKEKEKQVRCTAVCLIQKQERSSKSLTYLEIGRFLETSAVAFVSTNN